MEYLGTIWGLKMVLGKSKSGQKVYIRALFCEDLENNFSHAMDENLRPKRGRPSKKAE